MAASPVMPAGSGLAALRAGSTASRAGALVVPGSAGALAGAAAGGGGGGLNAAAIIAQSELEAKLKLLPGMLRAKATAWVHRERGLLADEKFVVAMRDRALTARVDAHQSAEKALHVMEADVKEALGKGMRTRQTLDSLESHILHLRNGMRKLNDEHAALEALAASSGARASLAAATAADAAGKGGAAGGAGVAAGPTDAAAHQAAAFVALRSKAGGSTTLGRVKTAAELVAEELEDYPDPTTTEPCPKCGKRYLPGLLRRHLEECDGASGFAGDSGSEDFTSSDEEGAEKEVGEGPEAEAARRAAAARRAGLEQCPICFRKFSADRMEKHRDMCKKRQTLQQMRAAEAAEGAEARDTSLATPPQAPLSLRSLAPTSTTIPVVWSPPVYDGGAPIMEYQLEYYKRVSTRVSRKETRVEEVRQQPVSTSRWITRTAVAHRGFTLTGLTGSGDYTRIRVRAINEKGAGPWSEPLPLVRTLDPMQPSPPLHVRLTAPPTPSTISLAWEEPMDTGGAPIVQYEVRYRQLVRDFATAVRLGEKNGRREIPITVRIPAPCSGHTLTGLLGAGFYADLRVFAVSEAGLLSPPSTALPVIETPPMDREQELEFEIGAKRLLRDLEVEVWAGGTAQTVNRLAHIAAMEAELAAIRAARVDERRRLREGLPTAAADAEAARQAAVKERLAARAALGLDAEDEGAPALEGPWDESPLLEDGAAEDGAAAAISPSAAAPEGTAPSESADVSGALDSAAGGPDGVSASGDGALVPYSAEGAGAAGGWEGALSAAAPSLARPRRTDPILEERLAEAAVKRRQYLTRIELLGAQVQHCEERLMALLSRRAQLRQVLIAADRRLRQVQAESWALHDYTGKAVDSSIVTGTTQRYVTVELKAMLAAEEKELAGTIAQGRREIASVDDTSARHKVEKERAEKALAERQRALAAFEVAEAKRVRAMIWGVRVQASPAYRCFQAWKSLTASQRRARALLRRVTSNWTNRELAAGFRSWRDNARALAEEEKRLALREYTVSEGGLGGVLLTQAERHRTAALGDATALIGWVKSVERELEAGDAHLTHRRALRGVDTLHVTSRGVSNVASCEAAGVPALHRALGPNAHYTQPLAAAEVADAMPELALVDKRMHAGPLAVLAPDVQLDLVLTSRLIAETIRPDDIAAAYKASARTRRQVEAYGPDALLHTSLGDAVEAHARALLLRAEGFLLAGQHEACLREAKAAEIIWGYRKDARGLLGVYRLLARLLEVLGRFDLGVIHWDRCVQMSREEAVNDPVLEAEALEGRGRCLQERGYISDALEAFEAAEDIFEQRNDLPALARTYKAQSVCLHLMRHHDKAEALAVKAEDILTKAARERELGLKRLRDLELAVIGMGVATSRLVQLEMCGPVAPLLRQQLRFLQVEVFKLEKVKHATKQAWDRHKRQYELLGEEAARAEASEAGYLTSSSLTGAPVRYDINDLRIELRRAQEKAASAAEEAQREYRALALRVDALKDEAADVERYLGAETRQLAQLTAARRPLRCVGLNAANVRTNHVLGIVGGGTPAMAACVDTQVLTFSGLDGQSANAFVGDQAGGPAVGEPVGHTKLVTALAFYGGIVYSGSADATIRVWDAETERGWGKRTPVDVAMQAEEQAFVDEQLAEEAARRAAAAKVGEDYHPRAIRRLERERDAVRRRKAGLLHVLLGHSGTVTALAVNHRVLVSGAADRLVLVWHPTDGRLLRRIRGHELSVTAIGMDDAVIATGSADKEVRVWRIMETSPRNPAKVIEQVARLKGHTAGVSAVCVVGDVVVSGAANGEVVLWDVPAQAPLRRHQVHEAGRPIYALQFDAVKLVTSGGDGKLIFSDLMSGDSLQTTRNPHGEAHVLALAFDTDRLVTVASDRTMRVWAFQNGQPVPMVKTHVLRAGEKLPSIARRYNVRMKDLLRWNRIEDPSQFYEGMRILVAPPIGTEGYERVAQEHAAKLEAAGGVEKAPASEVKEESVAIAAGELTDLGFDPVAVVGKSAVVQALEAEAEAAAAAAAAVSSRGGTPLSSARSSRPGTPGGGGSVGMPLELLDGSLAVDDGRATRSRPATGGASAPGTAAGPVKPALKRPGTTGTPKPGTAAAAGGGGDATDRPATSVRFAPSPGKR